MSLRGRGLVASFGKRQILQGVDLELIPRGITVLLGLNGAGKSTLLRILSGLCPPQKGVVELDGMNVSQWTPRRRSQKMAYLGQYLPTRDLSVEDYVLLGSAPWLPWGAVPGKQWKEKAQEAMEAMKLLPLRERSLSVLSGGERQRAALARTLLTGAEILLLDEPTASLDMQGQHRLFGLLQILMEQEGRTLLVSLHDPNLALLYGQRVLVLHQGKLIQLEGGEKLGQRLLHVLQPMYGPELDCQGGNFVWRPQRGTPGQHLNESERMN